MCGNKDAIKADLQASDMWAQKSMGARKENEKRKEEKSPRRRDVSVVRSG